VPVYHETFVFSRKSGSLLVRLKQKSYRPQSPFSVTLRR
jgi:uncharacterized protein YdeI (BOF family)